MKQLEKVARAMARTVLSPRGKAAFDADPAYYKRDFSSAERADFEELAESAIKALKSKRRR